MRRSWVTTTDGSSEPRCSMSERSGAIFRVSGLFDCACAVANVAKTIAMASSLDPSESHLSIGTPVTQIRDYHRTVNDRSWPSTPVRRANLSGVGCTPDSCGHRENDAHDPEQN